MLSACPFSLTMTFTKSKRNEWHFRSSQLNLLHSLPLASSFTNNLMMYTDSRDTVEWRNSVVSGDELAGSTTARGALVM